MNKVDDETNELDVMDGDGEADGCGESITADAALSLPTERVAGWLQKRRYQRDRRRRRARRTRGARFGRIRTR